jgi:hypothetical protein
MTLFLGHIFVKKSVTLVDDLPVKDKPPLLEQHLPTPRLAASYGSLS